MIDYQSIADRLANATGTEAVHFLPAGADSDTLPINVLDGSSGILVSLSEWCNTQDRVIIAGMFFIVFGEKLPPDLVVDYEGDYLEDLKRLFVISLKSDFDVLGMLPGLGVNQAGYVDFLQSRHRENQELLDNQTELVCLEKCLELRLKFVKQLLLGNTPDIDSYVGMLVNTLNSNGGG